jgi:hypothetical protein
MGGRGFVRRLLRLSLKMTVMAALVPAGEGCLVLSDPDFRGQNECVPYFLTLEAVPSVRDRPRIEGTEFRGSVPVRSCALTQPYEARIFLDGVLVRFAQIPESGSEIRPLSVFFDIQGLAPGCHFVEVFVSSKFRASGTDFTKPERADDVTFLLWTFLNTTDATVASCGGG